MTHWICKLIGHNFRERKLGKTENVRIICVRCGFNFGFEEEAGQ